MSIALHTRSICDECERPAVLSDRGAFLCEICDVRINGAVENSDDSDSSGTSPLDERASAAEPAPSPAAAGATFSVSGPSLATGMSRDPANAGGEHEEVAPFSNSSEFLVENAVTGTSPGACGTERERVGATNSNSASTQSQVAATSSPTFEQLPCPKAPAAPEARKPLGAALSFEAEVSELEAQWARDETSVLKILQIDGAIGLPCASPRGRA